VALFCVTYDTGYDLYVQIKPRNLTTIWNGSSFVTYSVGDWGTYDIALTESTPGAYYGTWPAAMSEGYYDIFVYSGATPASTDVLIGSGTEYNGTTTQPTPPVYGDAWIVTRPSVADKPLDTLYILEGTSEILALDYRNFREIRNGETCSAVVFDAVTGLTIEDEGAAESVAYATFSGDAGTYEVTATVNFSGGSQIYTKRRLVINAV